MSYLLNAIFFYSIIAFIFYWFAKTIPDLKRLEPNAFYIGLIPIALAVIDIEFYAIISTIAYILLVYFHQHLDFKKLSLWFKKKK